MYGIFWAITRMRVDVSRYPVLDEEIIIETWLQKPYKYEFYRDYLMKDAQGKIIARAVSIWVVLDIRTRRLKPASLLETNYAETDSERAIDSTLSKIRLPAGLELAYRREIGCSDIDMHEHLTSSRYISLITDCFTIEQHRRYQVKSLQIKSWNDTGLSPKVHVSSPRSEQDYRSHHDFVNPDDLYPFLKLAANFTDRLDVMVEAKQKDRAMFALVKDLGGRPMIKQIGNTALTI